MTVIRSVLSSALALLLLVGVALPAQAQDKQQKESKKEVSNIVKELEAHDLETLASVAKKADMESTLASDGPFTVLAPTNDAFATLEKDIDSMSKSELQSLLRNHLLGKPLTASEVAKMSSAKTASGNTVQIQGGKKVKVDDASVVDPDIQASNGVIHVIDSVLVPSDSKSSSKEGK